MFLGLTSLLIFAEALWQIIIQYPPSIQQLDIGVTNYLMLLVARTLSLILLISAAHFFAFNLKSRIKKYYWPLVFATPTLSYIWMSYPIDALKIFIISVGYYLLSKSKAGRMISIAGSVSLVLILNLLVFNEKPEALKIISLQKPQQEVNFRFQIEDNLNPNIIIPRPLKRLVYNKVFFAIKDFSDLSLTFFNPETLFFQEVHPLGQKSFVLFFWPQIFIFIIGIWFVLMNKGKTERGEVVLLIVSFLYFITSDKSLDRRFLVTIFPMSIIIARSIYLTFSLSSKKLKLFMYLLLGLTLYAWATNYLDRFVRPMYWLDNRPIAYDFVLTSLQKINTTYDQIIVPNTLFALKDYCPYYMDTCPNFKYEDFDLLKQPVTRNTLYVGFIGNFIGPNSENSFPVIPDSQIAARGLEVLYKKEIQNNIANNYGQLLLVVQSVK